jgi:hypothetical protein
VYWTVDKQIVEQISLAIPYIDSDCSQSAPIQALDERTDANLLYIASA